MATSHSRGWAKSSCSSIARLPVRAVAGADESVAVYAVLAYYHEGEFDVDSAQIDTVLLEDLWKSRRQGLGIHS